MIDTSKKQTRTRRGRADVALLMVTAFALVLLGVFWYFSSLGDAYKLAFLITETVVISIVLWQACDPFAETAQWIGKTYRLPGSVRGATLDAIASSLPEFFSGIFFVLVLATSSAGQTNMAAAVGEGYSSTIAVCAGSAIYNMILIPAVCALMISFYRKDRQVIEVERDVVWRDGLFFLACEMVLLVCLYQDSIKWWMGAAFVLLYVLYVTKLRYDAKVYREYYDKVKVAYDERPALYDTPNKEVYLALRDKGVKVDRATTSRIRQSLRHGEKDADARDNNEDVADIAGVFFHCCHIPLTRVTAWSLIAISTTIAAGSCYFLVHAVHQTASILNVPTFFVAVILAAAASSLPDTFLSIGAARRGDDSGAISNAFGSNIFDICICLSVPLLLACALNGWQPISLMQDGQPMAGLVGLRVLLFVLTTLTLIIIWHKREVSRNKAFILCGLYSVFIGYAVLGSLDVKVLGYTL